MYKKKSDREVPSIENIKEAVREILEEMRSLQETAEKCKISKSSLHRYIINREKLPGADGKYTSKQTSNQIFTMEEEQHLVDYILTSTQMHYGLSRVKTKSLAYEYGVANNKNIPQKWEATKLAGEDWLRGFFKRHPEWFVRKPEGISLSRASSFNEKKCRWVFWQFK